jgi:hypothetical protein
MRKTIYRIARFVPLIAIGAALMVPTLAAAADISAQPQSGTLVAKGAEVDVTVSFTCPAGYTVLNPSGMPGGVTVYLQQAISKTEQAAGTGSTGGQTCTGQPQSAVVPVLANVPGAPFRTGSAVASATYLQACDANFNCIFAAFGPVTIRISR